VTLGIVEESPVDVLTPFGALFALFVGATLLLFMLRSGSLLAALVLAPLLLLALAAQRHIPLFGFAAVVFLASPVSQIVRARADRGSRDPDRGPSRATRSVASVRGNARGQAIFSSAGRGTDPATSGALALVLAVWAGAIASIAFAPTRPDERAYPVGVEAALRSSSGVLLNEYDWGGWLIWNVPERPVFVDGRLYPFTSNGVLDAYRDTVHLLPRYPSVISRWSVSQALLRKDRGLIEALRDQGWTVRSEGRDYVLLELPR